MPTILNAAALLEACRCDFDDIENSIFDKLKIGRKEAKCSFDRTLPACVSPRKVGRSQHSHCAPPLPANAPDVWVVCTPVMQFHEINQFHDLLKIAETELLRELAHQKPKRIGNLHVACSVNVSQLCFELVLAIPFSEEE